MDASNYRKRKTFTLQDKMNIITRVEMGTNQSDMCRLLGLSKSTVSAMWKNRDNIKNAYEKTYPGAKKIRHPQNNDVDEALIAWFKQIQSFNIPVTGPILQQKANEFAKLLGKEEFLCSGGWIDRFKKRHNICFGKKIGDSSLNENWLQSDWLQIRQEFSEDKTFVAMETGLFYRLVPEETLKLTGEMCSEGELSKERLTVLLCTNLNGSEKKRLLVIGKYPKPSSLNDVKSIPVNYTSNKRAWITPDIWEQELRKWDKELEQQEQKILLLVGNSPAHTNIPLRNIKLVFLPMETTCALLNTYHGMIYCLKGYYRKNIISKLIEHINNNTNLNISIFDSIKLLNKAWQCISADSIKYTFDQIGLTVINSIKLESLDDEEFQLPFKKWLDIRYTGNEQCFNVHDYINFDNCLVTAEILSDIEIIETINNNQSDTESNEDHEIEIKQESPVISSEEALRMVKELTRYLEYQNIPSSTLENMAKIEEIVEHNYWSDKM